MPDFSNPATSAASVRDHPPRPDGSAAPRHSPGRRPKGHGAAAAGGAADWLGVLEHGLVRMFRNQDGREVNLGFELDGGFTGAYEAYMQRKAAQYCVQALEDSCVWQFDRGLLDGLLAGHPCWREMSGRIAEAELARKLDKELESRTQSAKNATGPWSAAGRRWCSECRIPPGLLPGHCARDAESHPRTILIRIKARWVAGPNLGPMNAWILSALALVPPSHCRSPRPPPWTTRSS